MGNPRGVRRDFEQRLAEAQQANQLILLVDQVDDLYEEELRVVSQRLAPFQRLILTERTPRLPLPRETEHRVHLPTLSASSAAAFLRARLVDEVHAYIAPVLLGAGRSSVADLGVSTIDEAVRLRPREVRPLGPDVLVVADATWEGRED